MDNPAYKWIFSLLLINIQWFQMRQLYYLHPLWWGSTFKGKNLLLIQRSKQGFAQVNLTLFLEKGQGHLVEWKLGEGRGWLLSGNSYLVANSTPMVLLLSALNSFLVKRDNRLVLPTPESPTKTTETNRIYMFFNTVKTNPPIFPSC